MATKKPVRVTRKFLMSLADDIYNSKDRCFMMLCSGTLQNGPNPKTGKPMHCGLGELYFAMTGNQPEQDHVSERDVIDRCVELSPLEGGLERQVEATKKAIRAQKLPVELEEAAIDAIEERVSDACEDDEDAGVTEFTPKAERDFRVALNEIPSKNDEETGYCKVNDDDHDSYEQYRNRASRVATQLRRAARCLPE
jgi:hypothetical protein